MCIIVNSEVFFIQYQGSKARFAKYLVPIIQGYINEHNINTYIEPFVGGASIIEKIECKNKFGYDNHGYLIDLLNHMKITTNDIPDTILVDEYKQVRDNKDDYPSWYVGLVGFCASFGNKWFNGYARNGKSDVNGKRVRQAINNIKSQSPNLRDIIFECKDFREIDISEMSNTLIYCDIPYKNTTQYKTGVFPYEEFYEWCKELSKNNIVLISEYDMPDGFECIWEKETKVLLDSNKKTNDSRNNRIEKLFICK